MMETLSLPMGIPATDLMTRHRPCGNRISKDPNVGLRVEDKEGFVNETTTSHIDIVRMNTDTPYVSLHDLFVFYA